MKFKVSSSIFHNYSGVTIGVVVAHNMHNDQKKDQVTDLLVKTQEKLRAELAADLVAQHPHIACWLDVYKKFGANPKKYPPSVYNLVQRVLRKPLPSINTAVDLYNVISLKYLLPAGGEDIDTLQGDLELTIAGNNEKAVTLLGDTEPRKPEPGEVFYKDDVGAVCRRWNWKEADRTKLTSNTHNGIFVLEAVSPVEASVVVSATHELAQLLATYTGAQVSIALINEQHPEVVLKKGDQYQVLESFDAATIQPIDVYHKTAVAVEVPVIERDNSMEHKLRLEKVAQLKAAGLSPWPANKEVNATTLDVLQEYKEGVESRVYMVAGRLMTVREHGKTAFCVIQDRTGRLQVYVKKDAVGDAAFATLQHTFNIGDIVWFTGTSFKTKTGEITIHATDLALLSKCLYPLPEKFHGLADIEIAYRQRYLDLISNVESKERFKKRSLIVRAIRSFLDSYDFLEVETPMLHPIPGGAAARPFITHHNTLHTDLYLRIAPELYLKRLVIGGFERVYEINRNFRNEGISTRHNPEFTMLEFYMAYEDYNFAMDLVEKMIRDIAQHVCGSLELPFGARSIDFSKPFARMSMQEAVMHYGNYSKAQLTGDAINEIIKKENITLANSNASWGEKLAALFEHCAEKKLDAPTFITQFPVEISPLAKRDAHNPELAARFELFIAGMEISNGFNELNDPFDQAARFKEQVDARTAGDAEAHHYDADYVHALEYALPPTVGVGIGIDRLVMLLTNTTSIKDVILFPTLKKKE